ncbi:hypothetical protein NQ315_008589 [Exocentrus adspersus]|uniref:Uncharacterized protein n=1 Tax=Exocentrus adspersus TaxID=1586481 RepID=A0AAV8W5R3_9CUCU|nr:hypothetical protein NQ315_008589 [Exocentrus adspersus]
MHYEEVKDFETNRQLLENQTFLFNENQKLQEEVNRLSAQLDHLKQTTVSPEVLHALKREKDNLLGHNISLKAKIRRLSAAPPPVTAPEIENEKLSYQELNKSANDLEKILSKLSTHSDRLSITTPHENLSETVTALTKKLEEEQNRNEELQENIRKLREDDEKYVLREKITDMKQLLTDLEVENTKLKLESEQLVEDAETYKKELNEAIEEAKATTKRNYELEDEIHRLKQVISDLENDNLRLKKEMIEELNEANRAKRVSADTEIALQHISEAYENKRKEVMQLTKRLEDAENIIDIFKRQFNDD